MVNARPQCIGVRVLNLIWGIAAISESHFFVLNTHYILSELKTWGWITLILGVAQLLNPTAWAGSGRARPRMQIGVATVLVPAWIESILTLLATRRKPTDGRGGFRTCDLSRVKRALSH